jgi:cellulose 1,4-beta-cellobiosidase
MKGLFSTVVAAAITGAFAAPSPVELGAMTAAPVAERAPAATCSTAVTLSGNPFSGRQFYANKEYSKEVVAAIASMTDTSLAAAASKVASTGTFLWLYVARRYIQKLLG